jgi:hypothetical protein
VIADVDAVGFFDRFRAPPRRDDWSAFQGREHMFFGLTEPFAMMRGEVEGGLRKQVADTVVDAIRTQGAPLFLTIGKKIPGDASHVVVRFAGFAVQAEIVATTAGARHTLSSTLTFVFGRLDEPGAQTSRVWIDLGPDAAPAFTDDVFQQRFLAFRAEHP